MINLRQLEQSASASRHRSRTTHRSLSSNAWSIRVSGSNVFSSQVVFGPSPFSALSPHQQGSLLPSLTDSRIWSGYPRPSQTIRIPVRFSLVFGRQLVSSSSSCCGVSESPAQRRLLLCAPSGRLP